MWKSAAPSRGSGSCGWRDSMDSYLSCLGYERKLIPKDEAKDMSLYRAVCDQLFYSQAGYQALYDICRQFSMRFPTIFPQTEFCDQLDHDMLVISQLYSCDLVIYRRVSQRPLVVTTCGSNGYDRKVVLCEGFGRHFDSIVLRASHGKVGMMQSIVYDALYSGVYGLSDEVESAVSALRARRPPEMLRNGEVVDRRCDQEDLSKVEASLDPIPPFPYRIAKTLDPTVYRNTERDSWVQKRKDTHFRKLDFFRVSPFKPGVKCSVDLNAIGGEVAGSDKLTTALFQDIDVTLQVGYVFIANLGGYRWVPLCALSVLDDEGLEVAPKNKVTILPEESAICLPKKEANSPIVLLETSKQGSIQKSLGSSGYDAKVSNKRPLAGAAEPGTPSLAANRTTRKSYSPPPLIPELGKLMDKYAQGEIDIDTSASQSKNRSGSKGKAPVTPTSSPTNRDARFFQRRAFTTPDRKKGRIQTNPRHPNCGPRMKAQYNGGRGRNDSSPDQASSVPCVESNEFAVIHQPIAPSYFMPESPFCHGGMFRAMPAVGAPDVVGENSYLHFAQPVPDSYDDPGLFAPDAGGRAAPLPGVGPPCSISLDVGCPVAWYGEGYPLPVQQPGLYFDPDGQYTSEGVNVSCVNFQGANISLAPDGSDLPFSDATTLRYFYNLGVRVAQGFPTSPEAGYASAQPMQAYGEVPPPGAGMAPDSPVFPACSYAYQSPPEAYYPTPSPDGSEFVTSDSSSAPADPVPEPELCRNPESFGCTAYNERQEMGVENGIDHQPQENCACAASVTTPVLEQFHQFASVPHCTPQTPVATVFMVPQFPPDYFISPQPRMFEGSIGTPGSLTVFPPSPSPSPLTVPGTPVGQ